MNARKVRKVAFKLAVLLPVLAAFVLFVSLAQPASAIENCADLLRFDYSTQAIIPILGELTGPGGAIVSVYSTKDYAFKFGNDTASYFYASALDQFGDNGDKLAYAGEMFYKPSLSNQTFMRRSKGLMPVYVDSGTELSVQAIPNYDFTFRDTNAKVPVIKFTYPKVKFGFAIGSTAASAVVVLAKSIDPKVHELSAGTVFVETDFGLLQVVDGRVKFMGSCTPACTDPDALDFYQNSTCSSTLVTAGDFCATEGDLIEYFCTPNRYCAPQTFHCAFGCVNGACIPGDKAKCESPQSDDVLRKGRTEGNYANGSSFLFTDACAGASKLKKYYCDSNKIAQSKTLACPGLCEDGACIEKKAELKCVDTDQGRNYEVAGTCSDSTGSYADQCSDGSVVEYYCDAGYCKTVVSKCPGCKEGVCLKSEGVSTTNVALIIFLLAVIGFLVYYFAIRKGGFGKPPGKALAEEPLAWIGSGKREENAPRGGVQKSRKKPRGA